MMPQCSGCDKIIIGYIVINDENFGSMVGKLKLATKYNKDNNIKSDKIIVFFLITFFVRVAFK